MNPPPPLPIAGELHAPASHGRDLLGVAALAAGLLCTGLTAAAIYLWHEVDQLRASLPPHATEGSVGFSLHFHPWLFTFCSVGIGIVAVVLLVASCVTRRSARQPQLTFLHIGAALSLAPLLYLVLGFAGVFLR